MRKHEAVRILHGALQVFFNAMLAGYAGSCDSDKVVKVKTPDGYKTITFTDGDFVVVDRYCVTPYSDYSAGSTTIFYKGNPVWIMFYGGCYPKEVIPFLKKMLARQYNKGIFTGGRGALGEIPIEKGYERLLYLNVCGRGLFKDFFGRERITSLDNLSTELGFHRYWGMSLL